MTIEQLFDFFMVITAVAGLFYTIGKRK